MNHFTVNTIPNLRRTRPSSPLLCCLAPAPILLFPFLRAANKAEAAEDEDVQLPLVPPLCSARQMHVVR
jgi:hypothetical protein